MNPILSSNPSPGMNAAVAQIGQSFTPRLFIQGAKTLERVEGGSAPFSVVAGSNPARRTLAGIHNCHGQARSLGGCWACPSTLRPRPFGRIY